MVLLASVILPHGAMPFDGDPESSSPAVRERHAHLDPAFRDTLTELYDGMCEAARAVSQLQADLYILHTPHGISLSDSYGIYGNRGAEGNCMWLNEWSEFTASAALHQGRSKELKDLLSSGGISTQLITCYSGEDTKLRWGEAIPIWYLQKYIKNDPKYLIISQDSKLRAGELENWRLDIGRKLAAFIESIPEKVVVVISGDLSHCHPTSCTNPLYKPNPKYEPLPADKQASEAYDAAVAKWTCAGWHLPINKQASEALETNVSQWINAGTPENWDPAAALPFLSEASLLDPMALSCGMKGFVVLHGVLEEVVKRGASFRTQLVVHKVPTYYGMLSATFIKN